MSLLTRSLVKFQLIQRFKQSFEQPPFIISINCILLTLFTLFGIIRARPWLAILPMSMLLLLPSIIIILFLSIASASAERILAVVDDAYGSFAAVKDALGAITTTSPASAPALAKLTGETILLLSPKLPASWTTGQLTDHLQSGGNLLVAFDSSVVESEYRALLSQLGLSLLSGSFSNVFGLDDTLLGNPNHLLNPTSPISAVDGMTGFKLNNDPFKESTFNPLIHPLLSLNSGQAICLKDACTASAAIVATLESRSGSRVMICGSPKLLSSSWIDWVAGRVGRAEIVSLSHSLLPEGGNRGISDLGATIYRVGDEIRVTACFKGLESKRGKGVCVLF